MAVLPITTTDAAVLTGPAPAKARAGGAEGFGNALDAALADESGPGAAAQPGGDTSGSTPPAPLDAALAALLGRTGAFAAGAAAGVGRSVAGAVPGPGAAVSAAAATTPGIGNAVLPGGAVETGGGVLSADAVSAAGAVLAGIAAQQGAVPSGAGVPPGGAVPPGRVLAGGVLSGSGMRQGEGAQSGAGTLSGGAALSGAGALSGGVALSGAGALSGGAAVAPSTPGAGILDGSGEVQPAPPAAVAAAAGDVAAQLQPPPTSRTAPTYRTGDTAAVGLPTPVAGAVAVGLRTATAESLQRPVASADGAAPGDRGSAAIATPQPPPLAPVPQPATPVAATPVAAPPAAAPSIAQQLQAPLLSLRSAPDGEYVVVVRVSPDRLGPVTVHATVSDGDLAVQLFAATPDARDALKSMLTDLRRDLGSGGAGTATTLSLGTGDAPQQQDRGQQASTWPGYALGSAGGETAVPEDRVAWSIPALVADGAGTDRPIPGTSSSALLDVLA